MNKVTLIDSPVANVANISRALAAAGATVETTSDPAAIRSAGKLVLPGVGSFRAAMEWLEESGISAALRGAVTSGASLLGICVGHQLLFEWSEEMAVTPGLGLLSGSVRRIEGGIPVPQIGWNRVRSNGSALFEGIEPETPFYFVNSFVTAGSPDEIATAVYGAPFTAAVQRGAVCGVQFHPEKSSGAGLRLLANWVWL